MRAAVTGLRLLLALLTVWCPACADDEALGDAPVAREVGVAMQVAPGELPGSADESLCRWECLACCTWLPTLGWTDHASASAPAAVPEALPVSLSGRYPEPLVPPPIGFPLI